MLVWSDSEREIPVDEHEQFGVVAASHATKVTPGSNDTLLSADQTIRNKIFWQATVDVYIHRRIR